MTIPSADSHQDIRLTPEERVAADKAHEQWLEAVLGGKEREERERKIVLTEAWEKALEEEFAKIDGFRDP